VEVAKKAKGKVAATNKGQENNLKLASFEITRLI